MAPGVLFVFALDCWNHEHMSRTCSADGLSTRRRGPCSFLICYSLLWVDAACSICHCRLQQQRCTNYGRGSRKGIKRPGWLLQLFPQRKHKVSSIVCYHVPQHSSPRLHSRCAPSDLRFLDFRWHSTCCHYQVCTLYRCLVFR